MRVLCLLVFAARLAVGARSDATSADVVEIVTTGAALKTGDAMMAAELRKLRLGERLTDDVVGFLCTQGLGSETVTALEQLARRSAHLPSPAAAPVSREPVPDAAQFQHMLGAVGQYVARYVRGLPDFTCDQITKRFTNFFTPGPSQAYYDPVRFHKVDVLTYTLRFAGRHDQAVLVAVNGKTKKEHPLSPGQSISAGEFGEDMRMVMGPNSGALIRWSRWQEVNHERTAVLDYTLGPAQTAFKIGFCCTRRGDKDFQESYVSPIQGQLYVKPENGEIKRMTIQAIQLPPTFEVSDSRTIIDYGPITIGGHVYTLPLTAVLYMETQSGQRTLNNIAFTNYKKFETESVLLLTDSKVTYEGEKKQ